MKKYISTEDMIGKSYGYLTVIKYIGKKHNKDYLECKCLCGNIKEIDKYSLINGVVVSCGCYHKNHIKNINTKLIEPGTKFGSLTVISLAQSDSPGVYYNCICSCGNTNNLIVKGTELRAGRNKSCGMCKTYESLNKTFGRLTTTDKFIRVKGRIFHICNCSCGNENILVDGCKLRSGWTTSCGCYQKERVSQFRHIENQYDMTSHEYGIGYTHMGDEFWFDKEDIDKIRPLVWYKNNLGYIVSDKILLHRLVMNPNDDEIIDHKNHITYDCRKNNLRICSYAQNQWNKKLMKNNTSGYAGVSKNKNKWVARIEVNGMIYQKGGFDSAEEAYIQRLEWEDLFYGDYAYRSSVGWEDN